MLKDQVNESVKITKNSDATKRRILDAAKVEFMSHGFDGARVDVIAKNALANKHLIYYYFQSKDNLFVEVLKQSYKKLRKAEAKIDFDSLTAYEGILRLVEVDWKFYLKNPELIFLLASENLLDASHIKSHKEEFWEINKTWSNYTLKLIEKGREDKSIKEGIDATQINIAIASLVIFYIMNIKTLSLSLNVKLSSKEQHNHWLETIKEIVSCWIKP